MISRETARLIAELFADNFQRYFSNPYGKGHYSSDPKKVYDFLYDNGFPAWLCNLAEKACSTSSTRRLKEFVMKLHTGESQAPATKEWTWQQRERLGQQYLAAIAAALLNYEAGKDRSKLAPAASALRSRLELDGYAWHGGGLVPSEHDALDVTEQVGALERLWNALGLADAETTFHHLRLSEEHYIAERWDDSIGNSRKFMEAVLSAVAAKHSKARAEQLGPDTLAKPVRVRDYLESASLLERKEKEAISAIYGLLSETGGHPYMARSEQARLLRHLALTVSEFVLLRLKGAQ